MSADRKRLTLLGTRRHLVAKMWLSATFVLGMFVRSVKNFCGLCVPPEGGHLGNSHTNLVLFSPRM